MLTGTAKSCLKNGFVCDYSLRLNWNGSRRKQPAADESETKLNVPSDDQVQQCPSPSNSDGQLVQSPGNNEEPGFEGYTWSCNVERATEEQLMRELSDRGLLFGLDELKQMGDSPSRPIQDASMNGCTWPRSSLCANFPQVSPLPFTGFNIKHDMEGPNSHFFTADLAIEPGELMQYSTNMPGTSIYPSCAPFYVGNRNLQQPAATSFRGVVLPSEAHWLDLNSSVGFLGSPFPVWREPVNWLIQPHAYGGKRHNASYREHFLGSSFLYGDGIQCGYEMGGTDADILMRVTGQLDTGTICATTTGAGCQDWPQLETAHTRPMNEFYAMESGFIRMGT